MAPHEPLFLYKETRLNLEPLSLATVVNVKLPHSGGVRRLIAGWSNSNGNDNFSEEERAYRARNLATSSSIYRRRYHDSPRSFLWRILDGGKILSIRAVDVGKDEKAPDANLILNIHFPKPLRPSCIAFTDPEEHDALCVFALDESLSLSYLILRPDVFRKVATTENGLPEAHRPHLSSSFGFKTPHRLVAVSANELLVTLTDGGIISFRRQQNHDALTWKESLHNPVSFVQGLRNFLPFHGGPTVKYAGTNMEITAAASVAVLNLDDTTFLFTVCLDHRMRVWNTENGMIVATDDILGQLRDPHEVGKWTIEPSQANLIRIVELGSGACLCVTFSPVGMGGFRFWKVTAEGGGRVDVKSYFEPVQKLTPPTPSAPDVWTLADFGVAHSDGAVNLWILWKNNLIYRVSTLECNTKNIETAWENDWVSVFADNSYPLVQTSGPCDSTDPTEKWLGYIFSPGRFSRATIDTALTMYERGLGIQEPAAKSGKGLAEAICSVLGSTASLEKGSAGEMDYERFRGAGETQWRRFYRLIVELDKQRGEALSLFVDAESGLTWVVCADCIAALRECSPLDRVYHNLSSPGPDHEVVAKLFKAGSAFIANFSDSMLQLSEAALRSELFEDSAKTDAERLQYFSDKSGFWRQITEEDCASVTDLTGPKFRDVTMELYSKAFTLANASEDTNGRDVRHPFTQFGQKLAIKGIQETAEIQRQILFCQLVLLVHMEFEFDTEEEALHRRFDIGLVYRQLIRSLKRLELIRWLAKSEFSVALSRSERSSFSGSPTSSRRGLVDSQIVTALEGSVGHLLGLGDGAGRSLSSHITDLITDVCAAESSFELEPAMIQCMLLKRDRPDLALELSSFASTNPFSTYIQGRVFLALRDHETAASCFRRAAVGLSTPIRHVIRHSAGLIDDSEWNLFYSGLANYYAHIVSLYDRQRTYSYVVDFARLSLQFINGSDDLSTKVDMQSRLFTASTGLCRFDVAHSALLSMTDVPLQHSCLRKLVEKMAERSETAALIALPFSGLQGAVDDILQQRCHAAVDVVRGTPWHQILYAWRIGHNDYRGAAAALLEKLRKLQVAGEGDKLVGEDVLDTPVTRTYLLLINTLSCVEPKQAWITVEDGSRGPPRAGHAPVNGNGNGVAEHAGHLDLLQQGAVVAEEPWRKVVSLADLRKQYQEELDRIAAIQNNQFEFAVEDDDDAMDL